MMVLPDSVGVQTPAVPKLLSNVTPEAFEEAAPCVHAGGGGGMPPPPPPPPPPGLLGGQLMATESLPFLMSIENEYVVPTVGLGTAALEMLSWRLVGSGSLILSPGEVPSMG